MASVLDMLGKIGLVRSKQTVSWRITIAIIHLQLVNRESRKVLPALMTTIVKKVLYV